MTRRPFFYRLLMSDSPAGPGMARAELAQHRQQQARDAWIALYATVRLTMRMGAREVAFA